MSGMSTSWSEVSWLVAACLLQAPESAPGVEPSDISLGAPRSLVLELRRRQANGRPVDMAGLLTSPDAELAAFGGRAALDDLFDRAVLNVDLPRYTREARLQRVAEEVRLLGVAGGPPDAAKLRELANLVEVPTDQLALGFLGADEYIAEEEVELDWVWRGFLAPGAVTMLSAPPKRGKSTLIAALVGAITKGAGSFLGRSVLSGPVVRVSEESPRSLKPKVWGRREHRLRLLDRRAAFPRVPWPAFVAGLAGEARDLGAVLVVVDTIRFWAAMGGDEEKDAAAVQRVLEPLLELAASGPAVWFTHHDRKSGGEDGEAASGSTAWAATVDCVIDMPRKPSQEAASSKRTLLSLSRWGDETPAALVFDRREDGSVGALAEGDRDAVGRRALHERIVQAVAAVDADDVTVSDVAEALEVTTQRVGPAVKELVREGVMEETQTHRGNQPAKYRLVETPLLKPPLSTSSADEVLLLSPTYREGDNNNNGGSLLKPLVTTPFVDSMSEGADTRPELDDETLERRFTAARAAAAERARAAECPTDEALDSWRDELPDDEDDS